MWYGWVSAATQQTSPLSSVKPNMPAILNQHPSGSDVFFCSISPVHLCPSLSPPYHFFPSFSYLSRTRAYSCRLNPLLSKAWQRNYLSNQVIQPFRFHLSRNDLPNSSCPKHLRRFDHLFMMLLHTMCSFKDFVSMPWLCNSQIFKIPLFSWAQPWESCYILYLSIWGFPVVVVCSHRS